MLRAYKMENEEIKKAQMKIGRGHRTGQSVRLSED